MFFICFCGFKLFQCLFNLNSWRSPQSITKSMTCKQTSLSVTNEKYLFYYKVDLYSNDLVLLSVFRFAQLTVAVKLVSLQLYRRKYLSFKIANAWIFSTVTRKFLPAASRS